jgi:hypothetical protein
VRFSGKIYALERLSKERGLEMSRHQKNGAALDAYLEVFDVLGSCVARQYCNQALRVETGLGSHF